MKFGWVFVDAFSRQGNLRNTDNSPSFLLDIFYSLYLIHCLEHAPLCLISWKTKTLLSCSQSLSDFFLSTRAAVSIPQLGLCPASLNSAVFLSSKASSFQVQKDLRILLIPVRSCHIFRIGFNTLTKHFSDRKPLHTFQSNWHLLHQKTVS